MLAQNFKTADELGLSERQRDALVKTLVVMETGKLRRLRDSEQSAEIAFNMKAWRIELPHRCCTVACIGGTAEMIGDLDRNELREVAVGNEALTELFFPLLDNWDAISPEKAASALRSYLTTGWPQW